MNIICTNLFNFVIKCALVTIGTSEDEIYM